MGAKLPRGILPLDVQQLGGFVTLTGSWVKEEAAAPLGQHEQSSPLPKCACP